MNMNIQSSYSLAFCGKCTSCFVNNFVELKNDTKYPRDYYVKSREKNILKPHYFIKFLWGDGNREGTNFVQDVVIKRLKDERTNGRVILDAKKIDAKTSPAGFYYKLGFRFLDETLNKILQQWKISGGTKFNAPDLEGRMFLPKENVEDCIRY